VRQDVQVVIDVGEHLAQLELWLQALHDVFTTWGVFWLIKTDPNGQAMQLLVILHDDGWQIWLFKVKPAIH